jgi:uncharacterized protein YndB with AHSA1/START domain
MIKSEASSVIDRPVEDTWNFVSDWSNFEKWYLLQPDEELKKTSSGPLAQGSTIQISGKFARKKMVVDMRISEFEPNKKLTIEYLSGSFKGSKKIYMMEADGTKTRFVHASEGEFQGLWKVLEFLLKPMALNGLKKTTNDELNRIVLAMENQPRPM